MDAQAERRALAQSAVRELTLSAVDAGVRPREQAVARWMAVRPRIIAVGSAVGVGVMALAGLSPARLAIMGGFFAVLLAFVVTQAHLTRRGGAGGAAIFRSLLGSILVSAGTAAVSGGLVSPWLVCVAAPPVVVVAAYGPGREATIALALFAVTMIAIALMPAAWTGPPFAPRTFGLVQLMSVLLVVGMLTFEFRLLSKGLLAASRSLRNVSEELIQEVAARRREIEGLGAKVAHEIKNPLTALKSLIQLERAAAKEERSQRRFEVMTSELARMETIVRDYLTFARPLGVLAVGEVDLARVVDDVLTVLEGRAGDAGVTLGRDGRSASIVGDERRLKEVLLNLGQNALEATPRGGIVTFTVEPVTDGARVLVRDSGSGIAPQVMGKLGTSFVTTREQGTGLGLAIARSIVKQHQGTLELENRKDSGGAVATMWLPRRPARSEGGQDPTG